jgi:hypothetical protein
MAELLKRIEEMAARRQADVSPEEQAILDQVVEEKLDIGAAKNEKDLKKGVGLLSRRIAATSS